jgi:hypothetical protein
MAHIAGRENDARVAPLLVTALRSAGPELAAGLIDALAYVAGAHGTAALAAIASSRRAAVDVAAVEALGNSLYGIRWAETGPGTVPRGTRPDVSADAASELLNFSRHEDDDVRATAVWMLGRLGPDGQRFLAPALNDRSSAVAANAAGALATLFASGATIAPNVAPRLCAALTTRRNPFVRANLLTALARARHVCELDAVRGMLLDGRAEIVRAATTEFVRAALDVERDDTRARLLRGALDRCADADADATVAARCRALRGAATGAPSAADARDPSDADLLDVVIVDEDDEQVASRRPVALRLASGVVRMAVTGPGGWVHERPAPAGRYVVIDPRGVLPEP